MEDTKLYDELNTLLKTKNSNEVQVLIKSFLPKDKLDSFNNSSPSIAEFLDNIRTWGQLDEFKKHFYTKHPEKIKGDIAFAHVFPFTNRQREKEEILSVSTNTIFEYFLIDGPSGYGKTTLLKELDIKFNEAGWHHAYVAVKKDADLPSISDILAEKLELNLESKKELTPGLRLSGALRNSYGKNNSKNYKGLALLIDLDDEPSIELFGKLVNEFLPEIESNLRKQEKFFNNQMYFRVVVAGRYLSGTTEAKNSLVRLSPRLLSPFNYGAIKTTIDQYLSDTDIVERQELTAHVIYFTGGHPACVAQIVDLFKSKSIPCSKFISIYQAEINKIVSEVAEKVRSNLLKDGINYLDALDFLYTFRKFNYFVLNYIKRNFNLKQFRDGIDFGDKLLEKYLIKNEPENIMLDDVIRRLNMAYLRVHNQEKYISHFTDAIQVSEKYLKGEDQGGEVTGAPQWFIESLYQWLQLKSINQINTEDDRKQLKQEFYKVILPSILNLYLEHHRVINKEVLLRDEKAVIVELNQDYHWEFEFAINYYFRTSEFEWGSVYKELSEKLKILFAEKREEIK